MMITKRVVITILCLAICLFIFSYNSESKKTSTSGEVPETCTLGSLAKIYEPVEFPHEVHAYVTEDCVSCHHHSQEGETPSCNECHNASSAKDLGIAGLKEAYHGNCMGCHKKMEVGPTGCTECHAKQTVKTSPVIQSAAKKNSKAGPETVTLSRLETIYEPVEFSHQTHALLTEDCAACHHHSPAGVTPSCAECHGAQFDPENLNRPGLKGAYHLQCMECHREVGAPVGCTECHAKKKSQKKNDGQEN